MIPLIDVSSHFYLAEQEVPGFYAIIPMTIYVRGVNGMEFSDTDSLRNSTILHEYTHHLQLSCTSAGLYLHQSQIGFGMAILRFVRLFKNSYPLTKVTIPIHRLISRPEIQAEFHKECYEIEIETQFRNVFLGWPYNAPASACPSIGILYDDNSMQLLPVGYLLLAENHARMVQNNFLSIFLHSEINPLKQRQIEKSLIEAVETSGSFQTRFLRYISLSSGFVDNLNAGDSIGRSLFLWSVAKALMSPMVPYFNFHQETVEWIKEKGSDLLAEGFWPGKRFGEIAKLILRSDLKKNIINLCRNEDFSQIDELVSARLGWPKDPEVIRQIEEQKERVGSSVLKKIIERAVNLHRINPGFLLFSRGLFHDLVSMPPVSWINQKGWVGVSDFWTVDEQIEISSWSILNAFMTSLLTGQEMTCPYECSFSETCHKILGTRKEPTECPLEKFSQQRFSISLADFEPIQTNG
jgi:hypothetical protein